MELNFDTLTKEQKRLIDMWYKAYINDESKLVLEEPEVLTDEIKQYKIWIINKQFQDRINQFSVWYSQAEIDTWKAKIEESEKVIAWGTSELLESLVIEWETSLELAEKIMSKASEYSQIYIHAEKIKREEIKKIKNL